MRSVRPLPSSTSVLLSVLCSHFSPRLSPLFLCALISLSLEPPTGGLQAGRFARADSVGLACCDRMWWMLGVLSRFGKPRRSHRSHATAHAAPRHGLAASQPQRRPNNIPALGWHCELVERRSGATVGRTDVYATNRGWDEGEGRPLALWCVWVSSLDAWRSLRCPALPRLQVLLRS